VRLVYPWIGCGNCAVCAGGDENLCVKPRFLGVYCDGGYSDHIVVPHPKYLIELDGLDPVSAAPYACSGVTTYGALRKLADVYPAEPIVVIGAGGLGLMCLSILKALGGNGAVVVDIDERKRRAALECGALAAVDGRDPEAISEITRTAQGPVRGVIDLVGSPQSTALGFDVLPKGGKLVIVGLIRGRCTLGAAVDPNQGGDDPGQLCRQSPRATRARRARPHRRGPRHSHHTAPTRGGECRARGSTRWQAR
jgi:propanol-preferring alcohol dehydrogenase